MNGWLIALICVSSALFVFWGVFALFVYTEGKDSGRRWESYYSSYHNDFWRPWAWVYDRGYIKYKGVRHVSTRERNKTRLEAKLAKLEGKPSPKAKESEFEDA